jgi:hypothetical protein
MPIERKAWSCKWKCGRQVVLSRDAVARHERICYHNPATRSCVTCRHFNHDDWDYDVFGSRYSHMRSAAVCTVNGITEHDLSWRLNSECGDWEEIPDE